MSIRQHNLVVYESQNNNACDEKDEVSHLRASPPRTGIMRSNSAPQAHNRSQSFPGVTQNPHLRHSPNRKKRGLEESQQNIPTLSDGVILINHHQANQAAAQVLASHGHTKEHLAGSLNSMSLSSTPLCDTNQLPSTSECLLEDSHSQNHNGKSPVDLWYFKDNRYPVITEISTTNPFITDGGGSQVEHRDKTTRGDLQHKLNGVRKGSVPSTLHTNYFSEDVSNGVTMRNPTSNHQDDYSSRDIVQEFNEIRRQQQWHQRQVQSEVILPSDMQRILSLASVKEKGYARLEEELLRAQKALEMKDEEVDELRGIRERLMKEVSDFTASLFEEVNSQLNEAATSEQFAKKQLLEAKSKIDMLSAEVAALKDLVLTSTPSSPNKHLHPQIDDTSNKKDKSGKPFWKTHRRSTSHHQFTKESREKAEANEHHSHLKELDTVAFDEFQRWRLQPTMEFSGQFFTRVQLEDIQPCLNFKNKTLADRVLEGVHSNSLSIEPIPGDQSYPRKCCLSESHKLCNYKIKFEEDDHWYSISQMSRNRIAAVCDFYAYLRYIVQGLVKCPDKDMFAELVRLRNQMAQARLGLI